MRQEDVRHGIYVRLVSDYLGLPAGTLAIVDSVGLFLNGEFIFTVRWVKPTSGNRARAVSDRSLNLGVSDLGMFEPASAEEAEEIRALSRPVGQRKLPALSKVSGILN